VRRTRTLGLSLLVLAAGCDGQASPAGVAMGDAAPPADAAVEAPVLSVTVGAEITYVTGQGEASGAIDLSHETVGVWSPVGDGFSFAGATFPSSGAARVDGIAGAPFWLQKGTVYFEGGPGQSAFDLGFPVLGSGNNLEALTAPTRLGLSLTGLQAWSPADELVMFSADAGERFRYLDGWLDPPVDIGASALQGVLDYSRASERYLIRRGDETWFFQLAYVPGQVFQTHALARFLRTTTLMQRDGQGSQVTGDMTGADSRTFPLTWMDDAFLAASAQAGPPLGTPRRYVTLEALPGVATHGRYDTGAPLVELSTDDLVAPQPMAVPYADPFPASWGRAIVASIWRSTPIPAPGLKSPLFLDVGVSVYGALDAFPGGQVTPLVGPPREPRVNGQPAVAGASSVGTSPLVSWTAPALGHADCYTIEVRRVEADDTGSSTTFVATLYTAREEARLPPQLLEPGRQYILFIGAFADPGVTPRNPYRHAQRQGYAQTVTGALSP
jgi:hypothetical protein